MATFDLNPHKEVGIDTFMSILEGQLEEHGAVALVRDGKVLCHVISPKLHGASVGETGLWGCASADFECR